MAREIGGRFLDDQPVKGGILPGRLRRMLCPKTGCFMGTCCGSRWPVQGAPPYAFMVAVWYVLVGTLPVGKDTMNNSV
jgi:hypothetical protein